MRVVKIIIKNNSSKNHKYLELFGFYDNVPSGIDISVELIENKKNKNVCTKLSYKQIVQQISHVPFITNVVKTTNNRLIDFVSQDAIGKITPLMPHLTIEGKPRPKKHFTVTDEDGHSYQEWEYKRGWNEKEWNIADTKECFLMNHCIKFILNLKKEQTFEIELKLD